MPENKRQCGCSGERHQKGNAGNDQAGDEYAAVGQKQRGYGHGEREQENADHVQFEIETGQCGWIFPLNGPPDNTRSNWDYRCEENERPCYGDRRAIGGSAIEEQYQRMCREMETDYRSGGFRGNGGDRGESRECEGEKESNKGKREQNEFFCYRATIVEQNIDEGEGRTEGVNQCGCRPFRLELIACEIVYDGAKLVIARSC